MPARQRVAADPALTPEAFRAAVSACAPDLDGRIALAVSGGPDSLALLLLAHRAGFDAVALTVDHGLRPEAAAEAEQVAAICAGLGVPHAVLPVTVPRAASIQAAAREARYAALANWCEAHGVRWLMTAHHADDQAETLLMRLSRGSGLGGMSGIRARRPIHGPVDDPDDPLDGRAGGDVYGCAGGRVGDCVDRHAVMLLRPLLAQRKQDLAALVESAGITAADDPSNRSAAYDRTAVRAMLAGGGVDAAGAAATAKHLAEAEAALAWVADEAWAGRARRIGEDVSLDCRGLPAEVARRLALRAFREISGTEPDGPALQRLLSALSAGRGGTLCGVRAESGPYWRFGRETQRRTAKHVVSAE